jgi:hypothetical protein|tara:strand:+ start:1071 stop:1172 length:102 start_codon:yes stop_codon:yes gene_type:complete
MIWISRASNFEKIHDGMEISHSIFGGVKDGKRY